MVDATDAALGLGAAFVATEATGLTNVTGGGGSNIQGQLAGALAEAAVGGGGGQQIIPIPNMGGGGGSEGDVLDMVDEMRETMEDTFQSTTETAGETVNIFRGGNPGGGGRGGPNPTSGGNNNPSGTKGDERTTFDTSRSNETDLQDWAGTGPIGNTLAQAGEAGKATGDAVNAVVEGTGDLFGTPGKSEGGITGAAYDAGNAFGEAMRSLGGNGNSGGDKGGERNGSGSGGNSGNAVADYAAKTAGDYVDTATGGVTEVVGGFL